MGKAINLIVSMLLLVSLVAAANYEYKYSPYTGKQDRTRSTNQSGNLTIGGYLHIAPDGVKSNFFTRAGDVYAGHTIFAEQLDTTTLLVNNSGIGIWTNASCIVIGNISQGKGEC